MRKFALSLFSIISYLFLAPFAFAQIAPLSINPCLNAGVFKVICELGNSAKGSGSVGSVLSGFIGLFFALSAIIAVIYLIYGGIRWVTSRGEKTEIEAARGHITAAIVGLIIVFLAFFLINFVLGFFIKDFSITNISLPSLTQPTIPPTPIPIP